MIHKCLTDDDKCSKATISTSLTTNQVINTVLVC